jgi:hypothetical protein
MEKGFVILSCSMEDKSMRKSVALAVIFTLFFIWTVLPRQVFAQSRARTESGVEVILYPDGTWKYAKEPIGKPSSFVKYGRPSSANKLYKTERGNFGVWYDEKKWKPAKKPDEERRWIFTLIGEDGYAMVMAEGMEIPTTSLKEIALENATKAGQDVTLIFEENRIVNGHKILCLKINGKMNNVPFIYYGYYYGGEEGAIQIVTFTGQKLFKKYEQEFTIFLNGLVISP